MTTEDQDAEVGRLVRERRDCRAQRQALLSKLGGIGKLLASVGKALSTQAHDAKIPAGTLSFETDGSVKVADEYHPYQMLRGQWPTTQDLHLLLLQLRDLDDRLAQIDAHLKPFDA